MPLHTFLGFLGLPDHVLPHTLHVSLLPAAECSLGQRIPTRVGI